MKERGPCLIYIIIDWIDRKRKEVSEHTGDSKLRDGIARNTV